MNAQLIILVVVTIIGVVGWNYYRRYIRERILDAPRKLDAFLVTLPNGSEKAHETMQRVWSKLAGSLSENKAARRRGDTYLEWNYIVDGTRMRPNDIPVLQVLVRCDPALTSSVKKALRSSLSPDPNITTEPTDVLTRLHREAYPEPLPDND